MANMIHECPSCGGALEIAVLRCQDCGMELHGDFQRSLFDSLTAGQTEFLVSFLRQRGNMSSLQAELGISYPTAKKKLDDLLTALKLATPSQTEKDKEVVAMPEWRISKGSGKASDIIKGMLMEHNGKVIVHTARGLPCEVRAAPDGNAFLCDKLPMNPPYRYEVFDVIVDLLVSQGGRARKGNGRNFKLGDPDCDETTVVGAIGYRYAHKKTGTSVFDPVFALAAILEWAGIAENRRGELALTASYQEILRSHAGTEAARSWEE